MVGGLQNGLGTRLGVIPQQTPVNPPQKKIGSLQNGCPKLISRPQTQSSYKLVSYLYKSNFPQGAPHLFSQSPKKPRKFDINWYHLFWLVDLVVSCRFFTHQWWNPKKLEKKPWFLDMAKVSIPFFALPEMNPKSRYEMIGPGFIL